MKHIKKFEGLNVSKNRQWDTYKYDNKIDDLYFVYDLNKKDRGKYLNTWFKGSKDNMITLKETDEKTSNHLYGRNFNPIYIFIRKETVNSKEYLMKAAISSIDNSSYGIWWSSDTLGYLKSKRNELMSYISNLKLVNGDEFLKKCIELGADEDSIEYD